MIKIRHIHLRKRRKNNNLFILIIFIILIGVFYVIIKEKKIYKFFYNIGNYNSYPYINKKINYNNLISYGIKEGLRFDKSNILDKSIINLKINTNDEIQYVFNYNIDSYMDIKDPYIYIYNTHQDEEYNDNILGIKPNIVMISYMLVNKLNNIGIPSIIENNSVMDMLNINNYNYGYSYNISRLFLLDKINTYSSLKYFIDIHRDSVKDVSIDINGKEYAKILFVIGCENKNWEENYNFSMELNNLFNKYYKGLSRGIYKKSGENVNGVYNQDVNNKVILIEIGGIDSNMKELLNTIDAICDVISIYLENE